MTVSSSLLDNPAAVTTQATAGSPPPSSGSLLGDAATHTPPVTTSAVPPEGTPPVVPPGGAAAVVPGSETKPPVDPTKRPEEVKGAPEKYEAFKFAEGIKLDEAKAKEFEAVARSLNLTQEGAQKLVDLQSKIVADQQAAITSEYERTTAQWKTDSIKELGANYQEKLAVASKALDRFGSPELRQFFNETGIGNNPKVIQLLMKVGQAISEDKLVEGRSGGVVEKTLAQTLYPNSN